MNSNYSQLMVEATRLTQNGDLAAATALIQRALNGSADATDTAVSGAPPPARPARPMHSPLVTDGVIDVVAREIDTPGEHGPERPPMVDPSTEGGRFVSATFKHKAGVRNYRLYIPAMAGSRPLPLVVMLHGCTQNADDFARGTGMNEAAEQQGFLVLYPEQSQQMNAQGCWNWFKHNHQQRGRGEPALLADLTRDIAARHPVDRARVYVAGLSAGGAMAAILGETYPDVFAAVGVHSGLAAGAATDLPSAFAAMQGGGNRAAAAGSNIPTIVFHGDADQTVSHQNAEQVIAASIGPNATLTSQAADSGKGTRRATRRVHTDATGKVTGEFWTVHGAPHAWSGGRSTGSFTDPAGPDATVQMLRFFLEHRLRTPS